MSRKLERKWRSNNSVEYLLDWKNSVRVYKKALHKARAAYYSKLIQENKSNPRFLFSTVARLTESHSSTKPSIPRSLNNSIFMTFFNDKILTIRNRIDHLLLSIGTYTLSTTEISETAENPTNYLDSFSLITLDQLTKLNSGSKPIICILDPIPTKLLKEILPLINSTLLNTINLSLSSGYVPRSFKIAEIKTLLKKPTRDREVLDNYRPISNLPFLSKILEKVIANQLCEFLQENNIYEDFQSGFRANHSTETALASDQGFVSVLILLDLSAAFDTIDHAILLQRLEQLISIKGTALNWFKSYFSDRFQFLQINDESSVRTKINHGVPQGSVLGPILFSIYMLPLGNIIRTHSVNFHCYADDTQLYLSIKPEQSNQLTKLQACLKDIKTWMTRNFLLLNSDKTEVIILGPKHLRDTLSNDIAALDDIALASNETVRNLGVIFDPDLSFDLHLKQISRTAFFHLRNISKIRNVLTQKDAEKLVNAFVTSRLDYCNSLLSGSSRKSLKTLQLVQNAAACVLTRTKKREHITPVLASLHWLPVKSRIEFKILLLTFKALNNTVWHHYILKS